MGAAETFLSSFFNVERKFTVVLVDPDTSAALDTPAMVSVIARDMQGRTRNAYPQDQEAAQAHRSEVTRIRSLGMSEVLSGQAHPPIRGAVPTNLYTTQEVYAALDKLNPKKSTIRGSNAAIVATNAAGRQLSKALVNVG